MSRSLRSVLESKLPAPLADIVIDDLQVSKETQRERSQDVIQEYMASVVLGWDFKGRNTPSGALAARVTLERQAGGGRVELTSCGVASNERASMSRSLRYLLETKMPAPLADIVVGYLQLSRETQRERHDQVIQELVWWSHLGPDMAGEMKPYLLGSRWSARCEHFTRCRGCKENHSYWIRGNTHAIKALCEA